MADLRRRRRRARPASRWPGRSPSSRATRCAATSARSTRARAASCWSRRPTACSTTLPAVAVAQGRALARAPRRDAAAAAHGRGDRRAVGHRAGARTARTERIPARTAIWAAGVDRLALARAWPSSPGPRSTAPGRVAVEPDLTLPGHPEVLALGDMVRVRGEDGTPVALPGVAPVAMQQGRYAAKVVRARLQRARARPFRYLDKGNLATIGRARAVADLHVIRLSGFPPGPPGWSSTSGTSSASRTACSSSSAGRSASSPAAAARGSSPGRRRGEEGGRWATS